MTDLGRVKRRLAAFAGTEVDRSPLYAHLAGRASEDDDVAGLLTAAPTSDALPVLLFAAAHRLLAADPLHPLSRYYATLGGYDGPDSATWPEFRGFVLARSEAMRELLGTRFVQTNEVQRAAPLYPAIAIAAGEAGGPIGLLEVGCSAGLLLGLDRFGYRYQLPEGVQYAAGPARATVGLHCAVTGRFDKPAKKLAVAVRVGLDRAPVDAGDEDELAWLEACVWGDRPDRVRLLRAAAAEQRRHAPELVAGDAVDDLAAVAARVPDELALVVYTSHVLPYLPAQRRVDFIDALGELARRRPLWWVGNGPYRNGLHLVAPDHDELDYQRTGHGTLALTRWVDGRPQARLLAQTDPHGTRMTWF